MSTITIKINDRTVNAKRLIGFLKDYAHDNPFVEIEKAYNNTTLEALVEAEKGNSEKIDSIDDFFNEI
ncbi:MAG: hypothetical protein K9H64_12815 [Bacteroidales bacterium]|nr:hypothetical protein [Bacteroidales bacterium]MCF8456928.1 hypothetical protein [Bacteroidales bacterium]